MSEDRRTKTDKLNELKYGRERVSPYLEMASGKSPQEVEKELLAYGKKEMLAYAKDGDYPAFNVFMTRALLNVTTSSVLGERLHLPEKGDLYEKGIDILNEFNKKFPEEEDKKGVLAAIENIFQEARSKLEREDLSNKDNQTLLLLSNMGMLEEIGVYRFTGPQLTFEEAWFIHNLCLRGRWGTEAALLYNFYFISSLGRRAGSTLKSKIPPLALKILEAIYIDEEVIGKVLQGLMPQIQGPIRRIPFPIREEGTGPPGAAPKGKKITKREVNWSRSWFPSREEGTGPRKAPSFEVWQAKDEREVLASEGALDGIRGLRQKDPSRVLLDAVSDKLRWYIGKSAINRVKMESRKEISYKSHHPVSLDKMVGQGKEPESTERPPEEDKEWKREDWPRCVREHLTERQQEVLVMVMALNNDQREAARRLNVTEEDVSQIMSRIREKIGPMLLEELGL